MHVALRLRPAATRHEHPFYPMIRRTAHTSLKIRMRISMLEYILSCLHACIMDETNWILSTNSRNLPWQSCDMTWILANSISCAYGLPTSQWSSKYRHGTPTCCHTSWASIVSHDTPNGTHPVLKFECIFLHLSIVLSSRLDDGLRKLDTHR